MDGWISSFNPSFCLGGCQIHYTARFPDGTVFDSSYKRGRPLTMRIGAGKVGSISSLLKDANAMFIIADRQAEFSLSSV